MPLWCNHVVSENTKISSTLALETYSFIFLFNRSLPVGSLKHSQFSLLFLRSGKKLWTYAIHRRLQLYKEVQAKNLQNLGEASEKGRGVLLGKNPNWLLTRMSQWMSPLKLRGSFFGKLNMLKNLLRLLSLVCFLL